MSSLHFVVPVAASPTSVRRRLDEAASDPHEVVKLFTTSPDVRAEVAAGPNEVWRVRVEGPQFRSAGTAAVRSAANGGSDLEIRIEIRGKGLLSIASPVMALASGKIEHEATRALQREFGIRG